MFDQAIKEINATYDQIIERAKGSSVFGVPVEQYNLLEDQRRLIVAAYLLGMSDSSQRESDSSQREMGEVQQSFATLERWIGNLSVIRAACVDLELLRLSGEISTMIDEMKEKLK